jgi:hypothetical protein
VDADTCEPKKKLLKGCVDLGLAANPWKLRTAEAVVGSRMLNIMVEVQRNKALRARP